MKLAYMAHPLGPDGPEREKNRQNATKWFGWLHDQFPSLVFTANWIILCGAWPETDPAPSGPGHASKRGRERGLEIDMVHVERSDIIFYVGGSMSPGMLKEQERATTRGLHQVDLTFMGFEAPERGIESARNLAGFLRELNKALERFPPLDREQRAAFDKELSERLSLAAMARTHAILNGTRRHCPLSDFPKGNIFPQNCKDPFHFSPALRDCKLPSVCTKENPCSWCRDNGAVSLSKAAGQPEGSNLSRPDEGGSG